MNNQFKIYFEEPVNDTYGIYGVITRPSQVYALKAKLYDVGLTAGCQLTFSIDSDYLEAELLDNRFYDMDEDEPDEDSDDYCCFLMQVFVFDQVFEIDPEEVAFHPIHAIYKELEQYFHNVKFVFDMGLKFTAIL
ncbi:hypothetical protein ACTNDP_17650 [Paenibacillus barengoltzii]|uniref:hypothetical protein n=1 Tax=Paenibacillus barengoltzii TaxID=343517 RepID=UPI003F88DADD